MQLFIIFIFSQIFMVMAINGCHSDRDKDHRLRENCTEAGLTDIPAGLTHSTKVLLFPRNLFTSLTWSSFQVFAELYELDLSHNKIPQLTPGAPSILPSLTVLRLGSNQLTSLPEGSFSACPHLTELYVDNNAVNSLSGHTFTGLTKLEILDLSSNHISVLPQELLHPLTSIETLYIEDNKVKVMPHGWFSPKTEVPYLYLSANPWTCTCSVHYLRMYLEEYEDNVYTRDGKDIKADVYSVECDSPEWHKNTAVINLDESALCSSETTVLGPPGDFLQPLIMWTSTVTNPVTVAAATPSPPMATSTTTDASSSSASTATSWTTQTQLSIAGHSYSVPWSWYESFTVLMTWTQLSTIGVSQTEHRTSTAPLTLQNKDPTTNPATPTERTTFKPSTIRSNEDHLTQPTITTSPLVVNSVAQASTSKSVRVFCFWLFAACLMVCVTFMVCVLLTVVRLITWYKTLYKPLNTLFVKLSGGGERVRLLTSDSKVLVEELVEEKGLSTHYRSVLFVHTEGKASEEVHEEEKEAKPHREVEELPVTLELTGIHRAPERGAQRGNVKEALVYRKTLHRVIGKEGELGAFRDVKEECWMTARAGKKEGELKGEEMDYARIGETNSGKCYSLILRENVEQAEGGKEEVDWVIGGWRFKRGGGDEEPGISWGQWLADYLPRMPWGLTTSPEGRAPH